MRIYLYQFVFVSRLLQLYLICFNDVARAEELKKKKHIHVKVILVKVLLAAIWAKDVDGNKKGSKILTGSAKRKQKSATTIARSRSSAEIQDRSPAPNRTVINYLVRQFGRKRVKPSTNSPPQTLSPPTRSSGGIQADPSSFFLSSSLFSLLSSPLLSRRWSLRRGSLLPSSVGQTGRGCEEEEEKKKKRLSPARPRPSACHDRPIEGFVCRGGRA